MTIVKKYDSIQGGREGGYSIIARQRHIIVFVLERTAIQTRFSAEQLAFIFIFIFIFYFDFDLNLLGLIY